MENDRVETWLVEEPHGGDRIDRVLSFFLPEKSRSGIQLAIGEGRVTVNGVRCIKKNHLLRVGDEIAFRHVPPQSVEIEPQNIPLDVVYEDDCLLVINKPKGLVVHPGAGNSQGTLVNALMFHCRDHLSSINGKIRPGIVHRIDKDTSGLLVVAKTDRAHHHLAAQLEAHTMKRRYRAFVYHPLKRQKGTVDRPIGRDPKMRLRMAVVSSGGKRAVTHYEVVESLGRFTLVDLRLETGRTHQIRVHMASLGHSLLGDDTYGPKKSPWNIKGQMLQAYELGFIHPETEKAMEFQVEMDEEFLRVYEILKKQKGKP